MPVYLEYALKASLCLAIIFLFYHLLLKQLTWYTWNRFFLLASAAISFLVPFINISLFIETSRLGLMPLANYLPDLATKVPATMLSNVAVFNYWQPVFALYVFIGSLLFIRLLIQIVSIRKIKSGATPLHGDEIEIYHLPKPVLPFSFLNRIFLNKHNYSNAELQKIIDHERVHVRQKHTIDLLITELICIINWYNPFAWLIKKAVRENLEFIADDAVLQKGFDRKDYQYLLLKVTGTVPFSIASNFTATSLKNRIRMMNKTKTGRLHLLKFALVIPLAIILLLAFRNKHEAYKTTFEDKNATTKKYILNSLTYAVPDKKVEAEVKKDKENCLLKTGEPLNLEMVFNEKMRLINLLKRNGYNNISTHSITFMIDTTLEKNSLSIQVSINLIKDNLLKSEGVSTTTGHNTISTQINPTEKLKAPAADRVMGH